MFFYIYENAHGGATSQDFYQKYVSKNETKQISKYVKNQRDGATSQDSYRFYKSDGATSRDFYRIFDQTCWKKMTTPKNIENMSKIKVSTRVCQKYVDMYARMSFLCRESIYYFFDANKSRISKSVASLIVFFRARSFYIDGFRIARRFGVKKWQSVKKCF